MAHGMVARNDHGILLSADQKNYVFTGYYGPASVSGNLYTFYVANTALSMYGVRLPVGGQGAVISVVGNCVTVIGTSVIGLLVFSPISGGGRSGYGFAMFNSSSECTFDSNQKHLVVSAAGGLYPGGTISSIGDVVIFNGCGIYPTIVPVSETIRSPGAGVSWRFFDPANINRSQYAYVTLTKTTSPWVVQRGIAIRSAWGFYGGTLTQENGSYTQVTNVHRYESLIYTWPNVPGASNAAYHEVSAFGNLCYAAEMTTQKDIGSLLTVQGRLSATNRYPYAASSYNTTQNLALVTDSALYL